MLITLTLVGLALLGAVLAPLLCWAVRFSALYPPPTSVTDDETDLPRVAVLLAVRGADPSLPACLEGLLTQNYPDYELRIIIDSRSDPAWEIVTATLAHYPAAAAHVEALAVRQTCSLKLSALVQALGGLDDSFGAVALIDADVVPHCDWLRDLVTPLSDPAVGATTGIRWYAPTASWGSRVRHLWNGAAVVVMLAFRIPWGGSLAFRTDAIGDAGLAERWGRRLFEDTDFARVIAERGRRLRFVPAATMLNRESTDLASAFRFIRRQLLNARLYHPSWPFVLVHGLGLSLAPLLALALFGIAFAFEEPAAALMLAAGLAVYAAGMGAALWWVERSVRRLARYREEPYPSLGWRTWAAVPLTQAVYLAGLCFACRARRVEWRGVTYEFRGPQDVRLVQYLPYQPATAADPGASLV